MSSGLPLPSIPLDTRLRWCDVSTGGYDDSDANTPEIVGGKSRRKVEFLPDAVCHCFAVDKRGAGDVLDG